MNWDYTKKKKKKKKKTEYLIIKTVGDTTFSDRVNRIDNC